MKMKKRSHRCDINRPRSRNGHKYSKCKKCLSMMMLTCIAATATTSTELLKLNS